MYCWIFIKIMKHAVQGGWVQSSPRAGFTFTAPMFHWALACPPEHHCTTHLQSYLHSTPCAATAPSLAAVLLPVMHPVKIALTANDPASLTAGLTASSSYMERQQQLDHGGENGDDDSAVTGRAVIE